MSVQLLKKAPKTMFETAAEARAYYQGRLAELAVRAGMRVSDLLNWAEHTNYDTYVSRKARSLRMRIDALVDKEKTRTKQSEVVWALQVQYPADWPVPEQTTLTLYHDPIKADGDGQKALKEERAVKYSVNRMEIK
jgi:hypothetical protein